MSSRYPKWAAQSNRPENKAATTVTIIKVATANVLENNSIYWMGLDLNKTDVHEARQGHFFFFFFNFATRQSVSNSELIKSPLQSDDRYQFEALVEASTAAYCGAHC